MVTLVIKVLSPILQVSPILQAPIESGYCNLILKDVKKITDLKGSKHFTLKQNIEKPMLVANISHPKMQKKNCKVISLPT